jgi:nitroreductase
MSKDTSIVDAAITGRRSIRKFLDQPVDREVIEQILEVSARAPSGTNMQPWHVHVVAGETMENLSCDILDAHYNHQDDHASEYEYYPDIFVEPFKSRRKKVGLDLYGLLDIEKGAVDKMQAQLGRNYAFFDAPVGLIFTIDRTLKIGSWLDYGMFLQNIMIAARARNLDTCPQAAFAKYHKIFRNHLKVSDDHIVVCGMSLGVIDDTAVENKLETEREPVSGFARFYDL